MTVTLEQIKQKQAELDALIRAFEEQEDKAEFPKEGDKYWYLDEWGQVLVGIVNDSSDYEIIESGNGFPTEERTEFEKEFRKVKYEMERCGGVFRTKMNNGCEFYLRLETYQPELNVGVKKWSNRGFAPNMWFPTEKTAQKALDTIGEERLLKYWFCVEVEE